MPKITNYIAIAKKFNLKKLWNALLVSSSFIISAVIKKPIRWGMPISISIEPTNYCNLHCPQCPTGLNKLTRNKGFINFKTFKGIIDQTAPYLLNLFIYFQGEPFLHKQIIKLITYATKQNIFTVISTNANIINKETAEKIVLSGLDKIIISLDGLSQDVYQTYRKGGDITKVLNAIFFISQAKRKLKRNTPIIEVQILIIKANENQAKSIKKIALFLGANIVSFKSIQICDFTTADALLPNNFKFRRYIKEDNQWKINRKIHNHCWRLWNSCVITWDGSVVPCCYDKDAKYAFGKIQEQSIIEIISGKSFQSFAKQVLSDKKQIDICRNCWG